MKTLKITFLLLAVVLLTVSGVQTEETDKLNADKQTEVSSKVDLLAHAKKGLKVPSKS